MSTLGLGIFLGALGSVCINTGNNMQSLGMAQLEIKAHEDAAEEEAESLKNGTKKVVNMDDDLGADEEIDTCQSPVWVIGTTIFITGSLLNFVAFAFAPQSILASLEGIQFVTNVAFGKCILDSHITTMMYGGTLLTIVGVLITVLSASVVGTLEANVSDLLILWTNPIWLAYIVGCCIGGFFLNTTHIAYEKAALSGKPLPNSDYVLPITYAMFSALFGTFSVVLAKILSELVTLWLEFGVNIFWGADCWFTYVTLISWLVFAGIWLYRMNEALGLYDPLFIIPLLQVNFILFAIISGGIYFKEFSYFKTINVIGFCVGVTLLVGGIFLLSPVIVIDEEDAIEQLMEEEPQLGLSTPQGSFSSSPERGQMSRGSSRRGSFTKMSITSRDMDGNKSGGKRGSKRGSMMNNFKFGAVAAMNDTQHDHRVNKAIMSDKSVDDSWKQDRVSNRRRLSAIPMGASRLVAVQGSDHAGTPQIQMAMRRQSRRSLSNPQSFLVPNQASLVESGMAGANTPRPSSKGVFGNPGVIDHSLSTIVQEDEEEEDDWETVKRKKKASMAKEEEEVQVSKKAMEPLETEAPTPAVTKPKPVPVKKPAAKEEPGILDNFSLPGVPSFQMPSVQMPWDTPDVKDTTNHTAI